MRLMVINPTRLIFYLDTICGEPNKCKITITGSVPPIHNKIVEKSIVVNYSQQEIYQGWKRWTVLGDYIQNAFYYLTADEREFLMTGLTPIEFNSLFDESEK